MFKKPQYINHSYFITCLLLPTSGSDIYFASLAFVFPCHLAHLTMFCLNMDMTHHMIGTEVNKTLV